MSVLFYRGAFPFLIRRNVLVPSSEELQEVGGFIGFVRELFLTVICGTDNESESSPMTRQCQLPMPKW